jgi:hypothetical protein
MAKIQDDILEAFFTELQQTEGFSDQRIKRLRELFKDGKKPKATDLLKVLSDELKEQLP